MGRVPEPASSNDPKKRRPLPAQRWPWASLITSLLQQYRDDRRFVAALQDLAHRHRRIALQIAGDHIIGSSAVAQLQRDGTLAHRDGSADVDPAITASWDDFTAFQDRWQLAQLPDYRGSWVGQRFPMHNRIHGWVQQCLSLRFSPQDLSVGAGQAVAPRDMPNPFIQFVLTGEWFPMFERQVDAKARLLAECEQAIDRSLDHIARQWEAIGWEFPGVRGQRETHVG